MDGKTYRVKFNCMDTASSFIKLSYTPKNISYGPFTMVRNSSMRKVIPSNSKLLEEEQRDIVKQEKDLK